MCVVHLTTLLSYLTATYCWMISEWLFGKDLKVIVGDIIWSVLLAFALSDGERARKLSVKITSVYTEFWTREFQYT